MEIAVFIQHESVVPETARLIGMNEAEVRKRFKAAQRDGKTCVFKTDVTAEQWNAIQLQRGAS